MNHEANTKLIELKKSQNDTQMLYQRTLSNWSERIHALYDDYISISRKYAIPDSVDLPDWVRYSKK